MCHRFFPKIKSECTNVILKNYVIIYIRNNKIMQLYIWENNIIFVSYLCCYFVRTTNSCTNIITLQYELDIYILRGGQAKWVLSPQMATFSCFEWSFFIIYITAILLLSPHVAMWRPLAHLWSSVPTQLVGGGAAASKLCHIRSPVIFLGNRWWWNIEVSLYMLEKRQ